ncbi:MAG: hypothetical protein ACRENQ_02450 [Gemmatimonadaceae bacterium]
MTEKLVEWPMLSVAELGEMVSDAGAPAVVPETKLGWVLVLSPAQAASERARTIENME